MRISLFLACAASVAMFGCAGTGGNGSSQGNNKFAGNYSDKKGDSLSISGGGQATGTFLDPFGGIETFTGTVDNSGVLQGTGTDPNYQGQTTQIVGSVTLTAATFNSGITLSFAIEQSVAGASTTSTGSMSPQ